uniref:Uncharacterized protein n=1 Tax=Pipistrellus kuhlii TaxID=59472 RepID=A0A7J7TW43_PIPKU|nr:hypothetical protein mPipKuh1_009235 [Pipistrellus kuhlii]
MTQTLCPGLTDDSGGNGLGGFRCPLGARCLCSQILCALRRDTQQRTAGELAPQEAEGGPWAALPFSTAFLRPAHRPPVRLLGRRAGILSTGLRESENPKDVDAHHRATRPGFNHAAGQTDRGRCAERSPRREEPPSHAAWAGGLPAPCPLPDTAQLPARSLPRSRAGEGGGGTSQKPRLRNASPNRDQQPAPARPSGLPGERCLPAALGPASNPARSPRGALPRTPASPGGSWPCDRGGGQASSTGVRLLPGSGRGRGTAEWPVTDRPEGCGCTNQTGSSLPAWARAQQLLSQSAGSCVLTARVPRGVPSCLHGGAPSRLQRCRRLRRVPRGSSWRGRGEAPGPRAPPSQGGLALADVRAESGGPRTVSLPPPR